MKEKNGHHHSDRVHKKLENFSRKDEKTVRL